MKQYVVKTSRYFYKLFMATYYELDWVPLKYISDGISALIGKDTREQAVSLSHWKTQQEVSCLQARKRDLARTNHAHTLSRQPPEHRDNKSLLLFFCNGAHYISCSNCNVLFFWPKRLCSPLGNSHRSSCGL